MIDIVLMRKDYVVADLPVLGPIANQFASQLQQKALGRHVQPRSDQV
jgi:hypothetical protein